MERLNKLIDKYIKVVAQHTPKTISERIKEQERPTIPAEESEDEAKMYEELLSLLKKDKKEHKK